jgi:RimJ/RimL family protein N-acetyltransferase
MQQQAISPPEIVETQRLKLRRPVLNDADFVYSYARDEDVARFMMWKQHDGIEQSRQFLERCIKVWDESAAFPWLIERKADRRPVGMIEITINAFMVNVGYVSSKPHWGRGYMTEAVIAVRDWALAQPEVYRFWSFGDIDNHASRRVMEKAGMQLEGVLRRWVAHPNISDEPRDAFCYSIVK